MISEIDKVRINLQSLNTGTSFRRFFRADRIDSRVQGAVRQLTQIIEMFNVSIVLSRCSYTD